MSPGDRRHAKQGELEEKKEMGAQINEGNRGEEVLNLAAKPSNELLKGAGVWGGGPLI